MTMTRDNNAAKAAIARQTQNLAGEMARINKALFEKPELCYQETFAAGLLCEKLTGEGFVVRAPLAGLSTAFAASRKGTGGKGPKIALIAEYDALPQIGHACGHSLIAATAFGAAAAIARATPDHPGTLMVIGTPAEEGGGGKVKMIEEGVFKGVDAAIMVHPSNKTRVVARMFAVTEQVFTFTGKAAHAAAFPYKGVNALDAGVLFYNAVSTMRQQLKEEARVHGIFTHGGDAPNIIPERVEMAFYIRALDRDYFREVIAKVRQCAQGAAKAAGCKVTIKQRGMVYEPFYPSHPMGRAFRENMAIIRAKEDGFSETEEIGSSDIGNLSQVVPSLHPEYAIGGVEDINHSRNFLAAVMSKKGAVAAMDMTKAMAMTVYDLLVNPRLMAETKRAFKGAGAK